MTLKKLLQHHKDMLNWTMSCEDREFHIDAIKFLEALIDTLENMKVGI